MTLYVILSPPFETIHYLSYVPNYNVVNINLMSLDGILIRQHISEQAGAELWQAQAQLDLLAFKHI